MKFSEIDNIEVIHVCTSCYCRRDGWKCCGYAGMCPHSNLTDGEFSMNAYNACVDFEAGAKISEVVKKHHISIKSLFKYREAVNKEVARIKAVFTDCDMKCSECIHLDKCKGVGAND